MNEERRDRIRRALAGLLEEGEKLVVSRRKGALEIEEPKDQLISPLRARDPEFFGYLASISQRLQETAGCLWVLTMAGGAASACLAVYVYWPGWRRWWVYALLCAAVVAFWIWIDDARERRVYAEHRGEIRYRAAAARLGREELITLLAGDKEVHDLVLQLKRDREEWL